MIFNNEYFHSMDRGYYLGSDLINEPAEDVVPPTETAVNFGPEHLGTSANPFQNQLQAMQARIREGIGKIEFNFPGKGKGSSQAPTPESYDAETREQMRRLAELNEVKTSTHATFSVQGFSGLSDRGFNDAAREQNLKEVRKAIDFAAEATTGGAIVIHTGEWNRPISEDYKKSEGFEAYPDEEKRATMYMVDKRTGQFVGAISKDQELFEPVYKTAKDVGMAGKRDANGHLFEENDWVDIDNNWIDPADSDKLFERVPEWNKEHTRFEVRRKTWKDFVDEAEEWNVKHPNNKRTPAEMFSRTQIENNILQAKGSSLFYAGNYDSSKEQRDKILKALKFYESLEESIPEKERWKMLQQFGAGNLIPPDTKMPSQFLRDNLKETTDRMRHIHEASSAADAKAKESEELLKNLQPIEKVGLAKTADSLARLGIFAMQKQESKGKHLKEDLYIAPENWQTEQFGGHPDELIKLVEASRAEMSKQLQDFYHMSKSEAEQKAKNHIKSTLDIGHLNQWKQHLIRKEGESESQRDERFKGWLIKKVRKMRDRGVLGHIHISDNFGFDDEHLTPGKGNVPIKELLKEFEKAGISDFVIEPGSFNPLTTVPDTWSYLGTPIRTIGPPSAGGNFSGMFQRHYGGTAPPFYVVGAYSPSNEWSFWSEVPLE